MHNSARPVYTFLDPVARPNQGKSAKVRKQIRSHVTTRQHRAKRHESYRQDAEISTARYQAAIKHNHRLYQEEGEKEAEEEDTINAVLPLVSTSADLFSPLTAAFSNGSSAFQHNILHDPQNTIGKSLTSLGLDAMTVIVREHSSLPPFPL
jgi:hypothetical protein